MKANLRTRLERLEQSGRDRRVSVLEQISKQAISDEDLEILRDMNVRGVSFEDYQSAQFAINL
jgi:hypothetical protein